MSNAAATALSAGEPTAVFAAIAEDEVEDAIVAINDFETETCGIDHEDEFTAHAEVDADANRVDVTAADYSFDFADPVPAGANSFVLVNEGEEAHFMVLTKIAEGHTLDEALAFEGDSARKPASPSPSRAATAPWPPLAERTRRS